jgi:hypothetical protein
MKRQKNNDKRHCQLKQTIVKSLTAAEAIEKQTKAYRNKNPNVGHDREPPLFNVLGALGRSALKIKRAASECRPRATVIGDQAAQQNEARTIASNIAKLPELLRKS